MIELQNSTAAHDDNFSDSRRAYTPGRPCPTCGHKNNASSSTQRSKIHLDATLALLRSGYVPSPDEKVTIATKIKKYRTDIEDLKDEIAQLTSRIKQTELAISHQNGLLAPVRRLPVELLMEVMVYTTGGKVDVCSPRSGTWQLERVCKSWKDVAASTQRLWTTIDVYLGALMAYRSPSLLSIGTVGRTVQKVLERSGDRPLSIRFVELGQPAHFQEVFTLFAQHSHRWKDISFSMAMLSDPPLDLGHRLCQLKSLGLSGTKSNAVTVYDSFQYAPQLSEMRLFSVPKPFRKIKLPWHQLKKIKATYCDFHNGEFVEMLRHTPNLVEFTSQWSKGLSRTSNSTSPLTLHLLEHLELAASPSELFTALKPLTLPALNSLYIVTHQVPGTTSLSSHIAVGIVDLIQRSGPCCITTLSLTSIDGANVIRILEETPDVTTLELNYIIDVEVVLSALAHSTYLVTNVEVFSMACKGNQGQLGVGPLAEIVRARGVRSRHPREFLPKGRLRTMNLTVREGEEGVQPFVDVLQPLSRVSGVSIVVHYLA